ncbi:MAG: hypothetical protein II336_19280 [Loktanella sp.]|nr:hypothetical protein [Loktanella sp.]
MNIPPTHDPAVLAKAHDRVAEITHLFGRIRALLDHSLRAADDLSEETPRAVITRMDQLIAAHLKVLTAEEAFNVAQSTDPAHLADLDAIRDELGRKLDRLRDTAAAAGLPDQPDAG